jgi:hypothetical protein
MIMTVRVENGTGRHECLQIGHDKQQFGGRRKGPVLDQKAVVKWSRRERGKLTQTGHSLRTTVATNAALFTAFAAASSLNSNSSP